MNHRSRDAAAARNRPSRSALLQVQQELLSVARGCVRSPDEAADLVQDVLAFAVARGPHDWSSAARRPWLRGVTRKMAAFHARTAARRRRREASYTLLPTPEAAPGTWRWKQTFLSALPPSLRQLAVLAAADLAAAEIRWILRLSDTALRQRLVALRRAIRAEHEPTTVAPAPPPSFGPLRAEVLASLRKQGGVALAAHDPDGHPLIFCDRLAHGSTAAGNGSTKESTCPKPR